MEKAYSVYIEDFVGGKWHVGTSFDCTRFRVGKIMISRVNLIYNELDENFVHDIKDITINGREFTRESFTEWLREVVKSSKCDIYYMKELMEKDKSLGWKPKGRIQNYIGDKIIIKVHFTYRIEPTGRKRRCDFIKELEVDKIEKVYDVLQAETKEEAERIWNA